MRVSTGSVIYDSENELCEIKTAHTSAANCLTIGGIKIAFVTALDARLPHYTVKYWGVWDECDPEGSLMEIMRIGGKWSEFKG